MSKVIGLLLAVLAIAVMVSAFTGNIITTVVSVFVLLIVFGMSFKKVRPTERGLIERLGKYLRFMEPGWTLIFPFVDSVIKVNITEQMIDAEKQEIITKDRLNATVDAQVYFKVKPEEGTVKASQYNVNDYEYQIVNLAKTTLRNIIGNLSYDKANSDREEINDKLQKILEKEAQPWGIQIVRTELKEIEPPDDVQSSMNTVIKAENEKKAALDFATATETKADGERRAAIKKAEGTRKATILRAEGEAEAIEKVANANAEKYKVESESLVKHFKTNAVVYKKLETVEKSLKRGSKYIIDPKTGATVVISEVAGITPIEKKGSQKGGE